MCCKALDLKAASLVTPRSGGEIEQFQHSYRNMGVKLKAGKNVLQSA